MVLSTHAPCCCETLVYQIYDNYDRFLFWLSQTDGNKGHASTHIHTHTYRMAARVTLATISKTRRVVVGGVVASNRFVTQVALPRVVRAARNTATGVVVVASSTAYAVARSLFLLFFVLE